MENKKGFIHIEVESKESGCITKNNIEKMDKKMMIAALGTFLRYLMKLDSNSAAYIWAKVTINEIGYKEALASLRAMNMTNLLFNSIKGETEDEKKN